MSAFYFHYQMRGGEEAWVLDHASHRDRVTATKPVFTTVLDMTVVPADNDWSKVRYRGPFYADFDAAGDLPHVCQKFSEFLLKLESEKGFDLTQARLYATGGKGFHIEIPAECFQMKVPAIGTTWLPQTYDHMARAMVVDTMDLRVYSGRRGRMWRTPNVQRESGNYKVPLLLDEALAMDEDVYATLVSEPRTVPPPTPPTYNVKLAQMFDQAKDLASAKMRGRAKRLEKSSEVLKPFKDSKRTPTSISALMSGEGVAEGAGFQALSMQLAIYATSMGMDQAEFVDRCDGLCQIHVSDSYRYNTPDKRKRELERIYQYMSTNDLYEFDVGPIKALLKRGISTADLGGIEKEDSGDKPSAPAAAEPSAQSAPAEPGEQEPEPKAPANNSIRKGFFVNGDGMWRTEGDKTTLVCRGVPRNVCAFNELDNDNKFRGYEFDLYVKGAKIARPMVTSDTFSSVASLKKFLLSFGLAFQGGDAEAGALADIMFEKSDLNPRTYVYPREGFGVIAHPTNPLRQAVKIYLTQDHFISSLAKNDPMYFDMKYRPANATSPFNIDIHRAPELSDEMIPRLHDLFHFNQSNVVASLLGWFVACHYHSAYMYLFNQFPLLQVYGEAGSGKSQSVLMLSRLHWYMYHPDVKHAASFTPFTLDVHASTSDSAPLIIDEFKPREMKKMPGGKYEKMKDLFKAAYIGASIGERGTINKGGESSMSIIKAKASSPIVFMGEALETETAIIERSVPVSVAKANHTQHPERSRAFARLQADTTPISALGRELLNLGFVIDLDAMRKEMQDILAALEAKLPSSADPEQRRDAPRMVYNRALILHALKTLKKVLARRFGDEFNADCDMLLGVRAEATEAKLNRLHAMSEMSKVMSRAAILSRARDESWELTLDRDYAMGPGYVDLRVDRVYDQYRRYCAAIHDSPLFDNLETFSHALGSYGPCTDQNCVQSELRMYDETGQIIRLDLAQLNKEGVQTFRS